MNAHHNHGNTKRPQKTHQLGNCTVVAVGNVDASLQLRPSDSCRFAFSPVRLDRSKSSMSGHRRYPALCIVCLSPLDPCTVAFLARQIFDPIRGCPVTVGMNVPNCLENEKGDSCRLHSPWWSDSIQKKWMSGHRMDECTSSLEKGRDKRQEILVGCVLYR